MSMFPSESRLQRLAAHLEQRCYFECCGFDAFDLDMGLVVTFLEGEGVQETQALLEDLFRCELLAAQTSTVLEDELHDWRQTVACAFGWLLYGRASSPDDFSTWKRKCARALRVRQGF